MRAAVAVLVAVSVACTTTGDPVGAYLDRLEQTLLDGADTVREIVPPRTAVTRTHIIEVTEARFNTLIAMEALQPPSALGPEHTALVSTYTAFVEASEDFLDETSGLDPEEFERALEEDSADVAAAQDLFLTACQAMVNRAAELGHPDVALDCSA